MSELSVYSDLGGEDFNDMRPQDKLLPRMRLQQALSPAVKNRLAGVGDWFDDAAKSVICQAGKVVKVLPLVYWNEWIKWNPNKTDKIKVLARDLNPNGELAQIAFRREKTKDSRGKDMSVSTEYYHYLVAIPEHFGTWIDLAILSFSKSGHRIGKEWLNRQKGLRITLPDGSKVQAPMGSALWEVGSKEEFNDAKEGYMVPVIGLAEWVKPDYIPQIKTLKEECKKHLKQLQDANSAQHEAEEDKTDAVAQSEI